MTHSTGSGSPGVAAEVPSSPGGLLVSAYWADPGVRPGEADARGLRFVTIGVTASGRDLEQLSRLVAGGLLTAHLEHTVRLEDVA